MKKISAIAAAAIALATTAQLSADYRMVEGVAAELKVADVQVREGEKANFVLILSQPLDFDIRYAYRTRDLTAKAGKDYVAESGLFVIPAGTRLMPLEIRTLKDDVIDKNSFELVLSDFETYGYGKVWGQYAWTDWWRVEGLALEMTAKAHIANALDGAGSRSEPGSSKTKRYNSGSSRSYNSRDNRGEMMGR